MCGGGGGGGGWVFKSKHHTQKEAQGAGNPHRIFHSPAATLSRLAPRNTFPPPLPTSALASDLRVLGEVPEMTMGEPLVGVTVISNRSEWACGVRNLRLCVCLCASVVCQGGEVGKDAQGESLVGLYVRAWCICSGVACLLSVR